MNNTEQIKEQILADAIATVIKQEKTILRLKIAVFCLGLAITAFLIGYFI